MVSLNKAEFNLRETEHLPRNTLHSLRSEITSRATSPRGSERILSAYNTIGLPSLGRPKYQTKGRDRSPALPCLRSGYRKERDWLR
jgi:hypothetical protein